MTKLPPTPDFASIEAAADTTSDQRTRFLALIGTLNFSWSNNESLFVYVLMLLLSIDQKSAAIVFFTLNTSRARLDLIGRLSKTNLKDKQVRGELRGLIRQFERITKTRNELNHCMFVLDDHGAITHTHSMRVTETKEQVFLGRVRPVNAARLAELDTTLSKLKSFNRDFWAFLPRLEAAMAR
ncbi:hypothetical protein [Pseudovibrio exalbescens]|uniref:Uncharacterized protein n=1 Tax=Pseudovibrio exalbescens TaxID=197461 RepID=A0A1U7JD10_9HYPH|nr:hypothetical protein [Pseudovibrio exalbescens]OKL42607.1 hypothetical protein A3843_18315 [Pseudovibrio exalbescens]